MDTLKKLRMRSNYSCLMMANKLGISKSFYWQIESGHRRLSYELAVKIANIFKIKPDEIFYEDLKKKL